MLALKKAQEEGKFVALIDAEHSFSPDFAIMCGLDPYADNFCVIQPDTGEQALNALRKIVKSGLVSLVLLDSCTSLSYSSEQEKEVGEATMAIGARYMSTLLKELVGVAAKTKCTMIFINQLRNTLKMYGASTDVGGGFALKYYTSLHLRVSRSEIITKAGEEIGIIAKVKAIKNKVGTPFKEDEVPIYFPHYDPVSGEIIAGIDQTADLIKIAIKLDVIQKRGGWFSYKDLKLQGEEKLRSGLLDRLELIEQLKLDVEQALVPQDPQSNSNNNAKIEAE